MAGEWSVETFTSGRPDDAGAGLSLQVVGESVFFTVALPQSGTLLIGRGDDCDVCIRERSISRRHAALHLGDPLEIEDLGGHNGTRVRGRRLAQAERMAVGPGDLLELGDVMLALQVGTGRPRRRPVPT
jgi:pSer/pThr/pTyr-binding forkhead associated (FHA) protein